jgi:putative endonuclease
MANVVTCASMDETLRAIASQVGAGSSQFCADLQGRLAHNRDRSTPTCDSFLRNVLGVMSTAPDRRPVTQPDGRRPIAETGDRRTLGAAGEQLAATHLSRLGYTVIERNHRTRWGEIDIIAHAPGMIVFVEVKTRRSSARAGSPFDAVDPRKQAQVRRMAAAWLAQVRDRPRADDLRFDVIGVIVDGGGRLLELDHREGVF